jgi:hypothetical protein
MCVRTTLRLHYHSPKKSGHCAQGSSEGPQNGIFGRTLGTMTNPLGCSTLSLRRGNDPKR